MFLNKNWKRAFFALFLIIIGAGIICFTWQSETDRKEETQVVKIIVKPLGRLACLCDQFLEPVMRLLSGAPNEAPQQTHRWNNHHLRTEDVAHLRREMMVHHDGIPGEISVYPLFHIPVLGGWRNYVVLAPFKEQKEWHVGWVAGRFAGVSRISLRGQVRMLIGPGPVSFFGVNAEGDQVQIRQIGTGRIGEGGPFINEPLL